MAWGNEQWAGSACYNTYIEWRVVQQGEDSAYVQHKFSVYVKQGNYSGTVLSRSWGGTVRLYGTGWYGDSGWIDDGWIRYGSSVYRECRAWYTGYSGHYYSSSCGSSYTPSAPTWQPQQITNASATRDSQTQNTVNWTNKKTTARPYAGIYVDRQTDGGDWANIADVGGSTTSYEDRTTRPNHTYRYRVVPHNSAGNAAHHTYTNTLTNPPTEPSTPTGCTNTRDSDTKNTVTWTDNPTSEAPYANVLVERSTDGAAFSQVASVGGSATSYADTNTSADHSYAYRVRASNASGKSSYSTSGTTYNTPSAPGTPTGARTGDTSVTLAVPNTARTATATEIQRSTDAKAWTTIATTSGMATSYADSPGGGTFYYRARNTRGSLASAWSAASSAVVTICAPAAPTLLSPASGQVILSQAGSIGLSWRHNPIDGSSQTAAEVRYSTDGSTWTTKSMTTAQATVIENSFALNSTVSWQVRTKGVHADFGPWSGVRTFHIRQQPQLAILSPTSPIANVPVEVSVQYVDASGSLAAMSLRITDREGTTLYQRGMGTSTSCEVTKEQWMPEDGGEYRLVVTARSTSGLQSVASLDVDVSFEPPKRASLRVEADIERGYCEIECIVDNSDDGQDVSSLSVWRVTKEGEVLIASDLSDGQAVEDRYGPLNTEYSYRVASYASSGASRATDHPGSIKTPYCFIYFGEDGIARGQYAPKESRSRKRANRTLVRYAGRTYPVLYDAGGIDDTRSLSVHVMGADEVAAFDELMEHGRCVFKSVEGDVFHAAVDVDTDPTIALPGHHADVSVSITRVDGEAL